MDALPDETPSTSSAYTLVDEVLGAAQDGIDAVLSGEHGVNAVSWFGHLERGDMVLDLSDSRECANTVVAQAGGEYFFVLVAKLAADHPEVALARRIERDYDERGHLRPVGPSEQGDAYTPPVALTTTWPVWEPVGDIELDAAMDPLYCDASAAFYDLPLGNLEALYQWHACHLGGESPLVQQIKAITQLPKPERKPAGQRLNLIKSKLNQVYHEALMQAKQAQRRMAPESPVLGAVHSSTDRVYPPELQAILDTPEAARTPEMIARWMATFQNPVPVPVPVPAAAADADVTATGTADLSLPQPHCGTTP